MQITLSMFRIHGSTVTLLDNTSIPVHFVGTVKLNSQITVQDVLFVLQFRINLLSISALTNSSRLMVAFFHDHFVIQAFHFKRTIGKGHKIGDPYVLDSEARKAEFSPSYTEASVHNVDAHVSILDQDICLNKDQLLCRTKYIVMFPNFINEDPCYIYPLAKFRKLPFVPTNMAPSPFDLMHCDIWGPYHEMAYSSHRFFVTLVDDQTQFTWVFLFKYKFDVTTIIPRFFTMMLTQFGQKIKVFRSDNARELAFTDLAFTDFFHD